MGVSPRAWPCTDTPGSLPGRYKELKKALKRCRGPLPQPDADSSGGARAVLPELEDAFFAMLGKQLEDANR